MKSRLILTTDRKSASEGEYIEIRWACDACPDSLYLAFDSGYEKYSLAVADSGSTRIPLKRSKGNTRITLNAMIANKRVSKSVDVRVRNAKSTRSAKYSGISRMKIWKEKILARWYVFRAQLKYWWLSRKKWQKALWIALLALWLGLLFSSIGRKPEVKVSSDKIQTAYIFS